MKRLAKVVITASLLFPALFGADKASASSVHNEMIDFSKTLIGTPYLGGGSTPSGFDCSGFVQYVLNKFDIDVARVSADQYNSKKAVEKGELLPGDLVFFVTTGKGRISHSGIYIGDNQFIHSDSTKGVKISNLETERYWKNAYYGASRIIDAPIEEEGKFHGLEIKEGQLGVIEVHKSINLWKRDKNNNLVVDRVLNPGEKFRVYTYDSEQKAGQFGLGDGLYLTDMNSHISFHSLQQVASK